MHSDSESELFTSYFYSRSEGGSLRFVSYDTAQESEITVDDPGV